LYAGSGNATNGTFRYFGASDVNGDGRPDLVTVSQGHQFGTFAVFLGAVSDTTTTLTDPATALVESSVKLSATVSSSATAFAAPSGVVQFFDGNTLLGTGNLSNGTATFNTSTLAVGPHTLKAVYLADSSNGSSSATVATTIIQVIWVISKTHTGNFTQGQKNANYTIKLSNGFPSPASSGTVTVTDNLPSGLSLVSMSGDGWNCVSTSCTRSDSLASAASYPDITVTVNVDANAPASITNEATVSGGGAGGTFEAQNLTTITPSAIGTPSAVSVSPAGSSGSPQAYTFQFSDTAGYQSLGVVNILVNNALDAGHACYLAYVVSSSTLVLVDDAGDAGGPYAGSMAPGGAGSIQNSQCVVSQFTAAGAGNLLTLIMTISFKTAFGNKIVYLAARDQGGSNSGWQPLGVWYGAADLSRPILVSAMSPAGHGSGGIQNAQTVTFNLTDRNGASDIGIVNVLINNFLDARQACYLAYVASANLLILVNDSGDAGGNYAGSMALNGTGSTIQNSQCKINGAGSTASKSGNLLTLTLNMTFFAPFTGNRIAWAAGRDTAGGNNTDWQAMGTWAVQ
jgi:uncharacterized repeat protein (TIGR01451 family)